MQFNDAFIYLHGAEGNYSGDPSDPGNWTGGKVNAGTLKGTKYGVSAAAYPNLDIANLSLADAQAIAKRDYWDKFNGDSLPYPTALLMLDFGYNAGISQAVKTAQRALNLNPDGVFGPATNAALVSANYRTFGVDFTTYRILAYASMGGWALNGRGWTRRAVKTLATTVQS
jgi:lysozyme family protein